MKSKEDYTYRKQGRGNKGKEGVLHAAVRKRRGQDEQIVPAPDIRTCDLFCGFEHLLHILKLPLCFINNVRERPDGASRGELAPFKLAEGEGYEITRNRDGAFKPAGVGAIAVVGGDALRGHDDREGLVRSGEGYKGGVGRLDGGSVLRGQDGAGVDGLTLGEAEGGVGGSWGGRQPVHCTTGGVGGTCTRGGVSDVEVQRGDT